MPDESKGTESSSAAMPEKKDAGRAEKSSPRIGDQSSRIVDVTDEYLGRSIIITGAPEPKK